MEQAHVYISGFVQNVGFRAFIRKNAVKLSLFGWTRNLKDGRVEAVFSCEAGSRSAREKIDKMIKLCEKGPFLSEVENINVVWEDNKDQFEDFKIL